MATIVYPFSKREQPFFDRLPADEVVTGSHFEDYDIATGDGKYVGWFGIVRENDEDTDAGRTVLTVEHKYFDGMTDAHLQAVSFNGSGDFQAVLMGTGHRIPPLSLVKVYGTAVKGGKDALSRIDAATAYWSVSGQAKDAVSILRFVLQTPNGWRARMMAANALAEIGTEAKAAVPDLIECLKSDTRYVVTSSSEALGKIGPDAVSAVPTLTARLANSDDDYTRVCIARALWRIGRSEESLPVLQEALENSGDSMAVSAAAEAMGEMGLQAKESAPLLRPLLKDSDSFVREASAKALEQIEPK